MSGIGLFDYMRQAGTVHLHEQNSLSNDMYAQLKSAQKMIKSSIKNTNLRVDIYDGCTAPKDKFVFGKNVKDCVYVEVKDLLKEEVKAEEFWKCNKKEEPFLRRIFQLIDKANGYEESRIDKLKHLTLRKFYHSLNKTTNIENKSTKQINLFEQMPAILKAAKKII